MYRELRDVFRLMNHKDEQKNFSREISLFERIIAKLENLYQNPSASLRDVHEDDNEGGNLENSKKILKEY